ncbi:MAG TPA: endonuclease/exonuclease/phosphatase family protein, partial [Burkholderiales bacterium]|nr:endonuclease/exonuclease/phosphatase family protein [Burkholderiales bacterium]
HSGMGQWKGLWSSRATVERYLDGIAQAIADTNAAPVDVVALNEVDFSARRSGDIDQARYLADALQRIGGARYEIVYGETRRLAFPGFDGGFGNAVLVRHPIAERHACLYEDARACGLADAPNDMPSLRAPGVLSRLVREARGLIKLTLDFHGQRLDVIVTHLEALATPEREAQATHLVRRFIDPQRTTVVLGDMNAVPTMMTHLRDFAGADRTHDILTSGPLADARVLLDVRHGRTDFGAWSTFPALAPVWPLDIALGSLDLYPVEARVMDALHSDHRGFYVSYRLADDGAAIDTQRAAHEAIRAKQVAHFLRCDTTGATRSAQLHWLRTATRFLDRPAVGAAFVSEL